MGHQQKLAWLAVTVSLLTLCGCVRRRLTVRTNPPGAMVYVDRQLIGPSPASTSYIYSGTRLIEVVGDGYRTEKLLRTFHPRWYQVPPLDFFSETLWPWELRDERVVDVTMVQETAVPKEELIGRAETLRTQAASGIATPLTHTQGPPDPPAQPAVLPPPITYPTSPVIPPPYVGPVVPPPTIKPPWEPGQYLREFLMPGGQPVQRIPEVGGLQGGGYRPPLP